VYGRGHQCSASLRHITYSNDSQQSYQDPIGLYPYQPAHFISGSRAIARLMQEMTITHDQQQKPSASTSGPDVQNGNNTIAMMPSILLSSIHHHHSKHTAGGGGGLMNFIFLEMSERSQLQYHLSIAHINSSSRLHSTEHNHTPTSTQHHALSNQNPNRSGMGRHRNHQISHCELFRYSPQKFIWCPKPLLTF